ncbi:non-ribosomal peptide synthetase [Kinneretia aquatilis]|uniref:non-ribosomal peptide synthetase n=1 Tax=Kinneretia aquatilis TaxID=2070761 RepID=UPI00149530D4|nr:non-ribosomal peptide synthetase [Paucibacter aquatile]WIV98619.1 non-ribosomal peptide synthetase [Paucibacter aquatile]
MDIEHTLTARLADFAARGARFSVVEGKLRSQGAQAVLDAAELAWVRQHRDALIALLTQDQAATRLQALPRPAQLPLSAAQQRLWFMDQLDPGSPSYNIPAAFLVEGDLDVAALSAAIDALVQRHESLRTVFIAPSEAQPQATQRVLDAMPGILRVETLAGSGREACQRRADQEAREPFDLSQGPLLRVRYAQRPAGETGPQLLCITVHHIIADGWSMAVLTRELAEAYAAALQGGSPDWTPLALQVADHALWQQQPAQQRQLQEALGYWQQRLAGAPALLALPTDRPRPAVQGQAGAHHGFIIPPGLAERLRTLAHEEGATLFMVLQAALALLLGRLSGQTDVCVGTPVAGRTEAALEGLIGCFLNSLVLRTDLSEPGSFRELLRQVRAQTLADFDHQALPFERLVDALNPERSSAYSPLYQVMLVLQNTPPVRWALSGAQLQPLAGESGAAKLDLRLSVTEMPEGLYCGIEYRSALFDAATIAGWAAAWQTMLDALSLNPDLPCQRLPSCSAAEGARRRRFWAEQMPGIASEPQDALRLPGLPAHVLALWQRALQQAPQALAVQQHERCYSHAELAAQALALGRQLQACGLRPGQAVAVLSDDPLLQLRCMLALMWAAAVFMPLDPKQAPRRLQSMLAAARPTLLLHDVDSAALTAEFNASWGDSGPRCIDATGFAFDNAALSPTDADFAGPWQALAPDAPVYLYFTSGSSGEPKGVLGRSQGLAHFIDWECRSLALDAGTRASQLTPASFDVYLREVWAPLAAGGSVHLPPPVRTLSPEALCDWLQAAGVTLMHAVPTLWRHLMAAALSPERLPALRQLVLAGEPLLGVDVQRWRTLMGAEAELFNLYGPTETTLAKCVYRLPIEAHVENGWPTQLPVGRPLPGAQLLVLDEALQPCAEGQLGEVYLRTPYRSLGYLGADEGHGEVWVPNPLRRDAADLLYRSGDLGRWTAAEGLTLQGRRDGQIKLRGVRIELAEVEQALMQLEGVQAAAAALQGEDAQRRLIGYLRLADGSASVDEAQQQAWMQALRERLPEAACPAELMVLAQWPLTRSGKLDRRALPAPLPQAEAEQPLQTDTEQGLAGLWQALLGGEPPGAQAHFFRQGGHSLLATRLVAGVRELFGLALPLRAVFEAPQLRALAAAIDALREQAEAALPGLQALPRQPEQLQRFALSPGQERLWFLHQLEGEAAASAGLYNTPQAQCWSGPLDARALALAWTQLQRRHELLRADIEQQADGELLLRVHPEPLAVLQWAEADSEAALLALVDACVAEAFALDRAPLARLRAIRGPARFHEGAPNEKVAQTVLVLVLHHAITDGVALALLFEELFSAYRAACGEGVVLPELALQYVDYAHWQRSAAAQQQAQAQCSFWQQTLAGLPALLELPSDRPRGSQLSASADRVAFALRPELRAPLAALCQAQGCTLFMLSAALLSVLLGRSSAQRDVCLGTPVANRQLPGTEQMQGFFVNTLPLRLQWQPELGLADYLQQVRERALQAFAHQDLPFEQIVEALQLPRNTGHEPLFQVLLLVAEGGRPLSSAAGLTRQSWPVGGRGAKFDISVGLQDGEQGLVGAFEYRSDLFDRDTIARLAQTFCRWLELAAQASTLPLGQWPLCTALELQRAAHEWNATGHAARPLVWMHQWPQRQLAAHADVPALVVDGQLWSYAQLEARSNQLARVLRAHGAATERRIAVCLPRTAELIPVLLAVLKAGAAYVPLDPAYPVGRLQHMLADSAALLCISTAETAALLGAGETEQLSLAALRALADAEPDTPLDVTIAAEQLAYLIYTSGSTGRPKGVGISHGNAASFLAWTATVFEPAAMRAVLAATSVCFDLSIFEIFAPWVQGGACWLAPSVLALAEDPAAYPVSLVNTVPSAMTELLRLGALPATVQVVNLAGEMLPRALVQALHDSAPQLQVYNLYGPTEDTTYSTWALMPRGQGGLCDIGRPMLGSQAYVLDEQGQLVPPGVVGELYLAGDGLARGYLGQPGLTAERFVPNPWSAEGGRMYRTGDRARYRRDGVLECLGRIDHQIKLRGFRIELGEVEAVLAEHPAVEQVLAVVRADAAGDQALCAYYSCKPGQADPGAAVLLAGAARKLPAYMLPSHLIALQAFVLTPNGKLDRSALPAPAATSEAASAAALDAEGPLSEIEAALAGAWQRVLGRAPAHKRQDFFAAGGHSLLATRLVAALRAETSLELPLRRIFEGSTFADLATALQAMAAAASAQPSLPAPQRRPADAPRRASPAQQRLWFLQHLDGDRSPYQIATALQIEGALNAATLQAALDAVVQRHEGLRAAFDTVDGAVVLRLHEAPGWQWQTLELAALPLAEARAQALWRVQATVQQGMDIARDPLFQALLIKLSPAQHVLLLRMHHIVSDGWSLGVLMREMGEAYAALAAGQAPDWAPLPLQYADHAHAQLDAMASGALQAQLDYWTGRLRAAPALLDLPLDHPRPARPSFQGARLPFSVDAATLAGLQALAQRQGASLFMVLAAALHVLLARLSRQHDICLGLPIANRRHAELEGLIGYFANTLALRTESTPAQPFTELLAQVRERLLQAYEHQDLPFESLVDALGLSREAAVNPLFQVMLVLQNAATEAPQLPGLRVSPLAFERLESQFDLTVAVQEQDGALQGVFEFSSDVLEAPTVQAWIALWQQLLAAISLDASRPLLALPLAPEPQRVALWAARQGPAWSDGGCCHALQAFETQCRAHPARAAVVDGGETLSFSALDAWSTRWAQQLQAAGVAPEQRVAICMDRSWRMIGALLAVWKAGAAYVPLDPAYPAARRQAMIDDAQAVLLLSDVRHREAMQAHGLPLFCVDEALPMDVAPWVQPARHALQAAYVIYTSGSTGRPKGVVGTHGALMRLAQVHAETLLRPLGPGPHACSFNAALVFDASLSELSLLLDGQTLHVFPDEVRLSPELLRAFLVRHQIAVFDSSPAQLRYLLEAGLDAPWPARIVCGGEAISRDLWARLGGLAGTRVFNAYGPTEACVDVVWAPVEGERPVIGRPQPGVRFAIVDAAGEPVAEGQPGELVLAGVALARGYLGAAAATAERFVPDPDGPPGSRRYATGDLVRWREPQGLEFLGRVDQQVKLRGFRIELEEIEAQLAQLPCVQAAAVRLQSSEQGPQLAAHLQPQRWIGVPPRGALALGGPLAGVDRLDEGWTGAWPLQANTAAQAWPLGLLRHRSPLRLPLADGGEARVTSLALHPQWRRCFDALHAEAWPAYFAGSAVLGEAWDAMYQTFPQAQMLLREGRDTLLGIGNAVLLHWDGDAGSLPAGWEGALREGLAGAERGQNPNALVVLAGVIDPQHKSRKLAGLIVDGFKRLAAQLGLAHVLVALRPLDKVAHPQMAIADYAQLRDEQGRVFDRWLRLHLNAGGQLLGSEARSQRVEAPLTDWARWCGMPPAEAGSWTPGDTLAPVQLDPQRQVGVYEDPCIWVRHEPLDMGARRDDPWQAWPSPVAQAVQQLWVIEHEAWPDGDLQTLQALADAEPQAGWPQPLAALRERLSRQLPAYMVPACWAWAARLPLTPGGKLDRQALPVLSAQALGERGDVAPAHPKESALCRVWEEVLGVRPVGPEDNFFSLGGDSIQSIRMLARAKDIGLVFSARQVFEHQTVRALLSQWRELRRDSAEQGAVSGPLELLPIQRQFLREGGGDLHHFNQAVLLVPPAALGLEALRAMAAALVQRHDALRLVFKQHDGQWQAEHRPWDAAQLDQLVGEWQLPDREAPGAAAALQAQLDQAQASLDLTEGPLWRWLLCRDARGAWRLLWVVHHLLVDGVSWRILMKDLQLLWSQWQDGGAAALRLPPKTDALQHWGLALRQRADSLELATERAGWQWISQAPVDPWPIVMAPALDTVAQTRGLRLRLDEASTQALLGPCHQALETQINDLLLAALAWALRRWAGIRHGRIELEGHGREPWSEEMDLSETVGWFTSVFPLLLSTPADDGDWAGLIRGVKQRLRAVPRRGLGHGLLRELATAPLAAGEPAPLLFNYLGQFGEAASDEGDPGQQAWQPAPESPGALMGAAIRRTHAMVLNGGVYQGRLQFTLDFNGEAQDGGQMHAFMDALQLGLEQIAQACLAMAPPRWPDPQGAQRELLHGPVADMPNRGWFFRRLDLHHWNVVDLLNLDAELAPALLARASELLLTHHDELRSVWAHRDGRWQQWVRLPEEMPPSFFSVDLSALPVAEQRVAVEALCAELQASLDIEHALFKLVHLRLADQSARLLLLYHHLLVDKYACTVVLDDLRALCEALQAGRAPQLPAKTGSMVSLAQLWQRRAAQLGEPDVEGWRRITAARFRPWPEEAGERPASLLPGAGLPGFSLVRWTAAQTRRLLERSQRSGAPALNDWLHAAIAEAYGRWTGSPAVQIIQVHNGRSHLPEDLDLTRTVGWCGHYAVLALDLNGADSVEERLQRARQAHAALQGYEADYSLLRDAHADPAIRAAMAALPDPQLEFQYHPPSMQQLGAASDAQAWSKALEAAGSTDGPIRARFRPFSACSIDEGVLSFIWAYCRTQFEPASFERFTHSVTQILDEWLDATALEAPNPVHVLNPQS